MKTYGKPKEVTRNIGNHREAKMLMEMTRNQQKA